MHSPLGTNKIYEAFSLNISNCGFTGWLGWIINLFIWAVLDIFRTNTKYFKLIYMKTTKTGIKVDNSYQYNEEVSERKRHKRAQK